MYAPSIAILIVWLIIGLCFLYLDNRPQRRDHMVRNRRSGKLARRR
jgi:hypothetical protein